MSEPLNITILIAVRNEAANMEHCLASLEPVKRVLVVDSGSTDGTVEIARRHGAEVVQFSWNGRYPRKRQWALDHLGISTDWVILLDADESITPSLWREIRTVIASHNPKAAYLATKEFHFLGRRMQFGGFSHSAVFLFKKGQARFENLLSDCGENLDMEVHERLIVQGDVGAFGSPLEHRDKKGLAAYIARHESYARWEAELRYRWIATRTYGASSISADWRGNAQERRRFLKLLAMRLPGEAIFWFIYHYFIRGGYLEGRAGYLASKVRYNYIRQVNKLVKRKIRNNIPL